MAVIQATIALVVFFYIRSLYQQPTWKGQNSSAFIKNSFEEPGRFSPVPSTSSNANISQIISKRKAGESVPFLNESRKVMKENYVSSAAWSSASSSSNSYFLEDFSISDDVCFESSKKPSFKNNLPILGKPVSTFGSNQNAKRTIPSPSASTSSGKMSQPTSTVTLKAISDRAAKPAGMKILTGSIECLSKWSHLKENKNLLFEVIGHLASVRSNGHERGKLLILREDTGPVFQCVFYEIDRFLPPIEPGSLIRCVGWLTGINKMQAVSVREAYPQEGTYIQRLIFISQRAAQELLLASKNK